MAKENVIPSEIQLISCKTLAKLLALSTRQIQKLDKLKLLPKALRIAGSLRWSERTIQDWIKKGCPSRKVFEASKEVQADEK
jgi:predicted DNA-binding transcriptional regulator AlpA